MKKYMNMKKFSPYIILALIIFHFSTNLSACEISSSLVKPEKKQTKFLSAGILEDNKLKSIYSRVDGELEFSKLSNGTIVEKDQLVAIIKDESRKSALESALSSVEEWEKKYQIDSELSKSGMHSKMDFLKTKTSLKNAIVAYEKAKRDNEGLQILSPIKGMVIEKKFSVGDIVSKNSLLAKILSLESFKVSLNVSPKMVGKLKIDQAAKVITADGKVYNGSIKKIKKYANPETRSYEVSIVVELKHDEEFPLVGLDSICKVEISMDEKYIYSVPSSAIILDSANNPSLQILDNSNHVRFVPINVEGDTENALLVSMAEPSYHDILEGDEIQLITRSKRKLEDGELIKTKESLLQD